MKRRVLAPLMISMLAAVTPVGCGGDPDDVGKLVPVEGTVTKEGRPLANAMLTFVPDVSNETSTSGTDMTGPDGRFSAKYRSRPGLSPGKYKLLVTERDGASGPSMPEEIARSGYMSQLASRSANRKAPPETSIYADAAKTPFTVEVSEGGETGLVFEIK